MGWNLHLVKIHKTACCWIWGWLCEFPLQAYSDFDEGARRTEGRPVASKQRPARPSGVHQLLFGLQMRSEHNKSYRIICSSNFLWCLYYTTRRVGQFAAIPRSHRERVLNSQEFDPQALERVFISTRGGALFNALLLHRILKGFLNFHFTVGTQGLFWPNNPKWTNKNLRVDFSPKCLDVFFKKY